MSASLPFKSKKFLDLKAKWYKKLKKSGFDDAERDEDRLERYHSYDFRYKKREEYCETNQAYYYMVTQFLNDYTFTDRVEQVIWSYYSEGMSMRDVAKTLNKVRKIKTNKDAVNKIIQKLKKIMYAMYVENSYNDEF